MTAAELIEKLKTMDQSAPVWIGGVCGYYSLDSIKIYEDDIVFYDKDKKDVVHSVVIDLEPKD